MSLQWKKNMRRLQSVFFLQNTVRSWREYKTYCSSALDSLSFVTVVKWRTSKAFRWMRAILLGIGTYNSISLTHRFVCALKCVLPHLKDFFFSYISVRAPIHVLAFSF